MSNGFGSFGDLSFASLPPDIILIEYKSGKMVCYIKSPRISEIKYIASDMSSYIKSSKINISDINTDQYKLICYINPKEIFNIQTPPFSTISQTVSINIISDSITIAT